jgi:hypothetical protein
LHLCRKTAEQNTLEAVEYGVMGRVSKETKRGLDGSKNNIFIGEISW